MGEMFARPQCWRPETKNLMIVTIIKEEDQADISLVDFLVFRDLASRKGGGLEGICLPTSFRSFLYLPLDKMVKEHFVKVVHVDTRLLI